MAREVWLWFSANVSAEQRQTILTDLARAGVTSSGDDDYETENSGIVFFTELTAELCVLLGETSRRGLARVLAVALTPAALAKGGTWALLKAGASDVFAWDHSTEPAREISARFERWQEVDRIVQSALVQENLVGQSHAWVRVLRQIVEVARFTDASVLITGESGTGKELIARLIHTLDTRKNKGELVVSDCTTIVPELSGSEFFGHERGAFTGAVAARDGAFALADKGTLFLDEVGELPATLQAELLRVVQERAFKRVGSNNWQKTDFRLVCATNRNLIAEQAAARFRRDLYYRIAACTCHLPPLSERREDILPLTRHFIESQRPDTPIKLDDAVRDYLLAREYPGNVRDLKQLVTRMLLRHVGPGPITVGDIPEDERPADDFEIADWRGNGFDHSIQLALQQGMGLKEIGRAAEDAAERIALDEAEGNLQRAAAKLGVTDRALQMRRVARKQNGHQTTVRYEER
ncbi:MAG: sigma-54-dependent Fis family transcriptional regulator [Acidobacteria bacterium]|nr:sigma-54-dependent Fis family transcriptional regulator [Acidobacteriota bacterium]